MSFQFDLEADLKSVFFTDFEHSAQIEGETIAGYLHTSTHEFGVLDSNQFIFEARSSSLPPLVRRMSVSVEGKSFIYISKDVKGDITYLILELSSNG